MGHPPIRVGLLGYGYAGRTIHAPLIAATEGLQLVAVGSRDAARVHADWGTGVAVAPPEAVLARNDLDLVVVATPNDTHHPLAMAALQGGRHVLVDKPLALDVAQAGELVQAARRAQRVLSVFHNRRLDSDFLAVQALLAEGALGRVTTARLHFDRFRPQVRDRWREGAGPGAGLWADLGPHLLDQALVLFGRPDTLALERRRQRDGARSDDGFSARLRWHTGAHAGLAVDLHASMLSAHAGPRFEVHGTRGSAVVDGLDAQEDALKALVAAGGGAAAWAQALRAHDWGLDARRLRLHLLGADDPADSAPRATERPLPAGRWPAFMAGLRDALHGQAPLPVTALQALAVQRLIDLGVESDEAGRTCTVPAQV